MHPKLIDTILDGPYALTPRPEPVPGDLRLSWGIGLVILILGNSHGKRASLQKLHFLAHVIRTRHTRDKVRQVFLHALRPSEILIRIEPWLNRALAFAKGAGLITIMKGKSVKLTDDGIDILDMINRDSKIFTEEKLFLNAISTQATEDNIERILRMEVVP